MNGQRNGYRASHKAVNDERMYSSQAAADFLGIHRSTLYLAAQRMKLIPDAYTPGGHARFSQETLERFRDRLAFDSATGGDGTMTRAVAGVVATLSHCTQLEPVADAIAEAALTVCPSFETCMVVAHNAERLRSDELRLVASRGLPRQLVIEYEWLRRRPGLEFISTRLIRLGKRFLCGDVLAEDAAAPAGAVMALSGVGYRSCAALPCVSDGVTLGMLLCFGRPACDLSESEVVALGNLADVLTVALRRWRRDEATMRQTETISELVRQSQHAQNGVALNEYLFTLRRICQEGARAKLVSEWNIADTDMEAPAPLADLLRAAAEEGAPQRAEWAEEDGGRIAIATPALAQDAHAAVGAIWRRQDVCSGMELALLQVYAQACSAVASR